MDDSLLYETIQFVIPKSAFAAIDSAAIVAKARADGIERLRIEANDRGAGGNKTRITCRVIMASDTRLYDDLEEGKRAAVEAIDAEHKRPRDSIRAGGIPRGDGT